METTLVQVENDLLMFLLTGKVCINRIITVLKYYLLCIKLK
nr:MAG TPA: hypothetical protein [Caudoviricetes sp.]